MITRALPLVLMLGAYPAGAGALSTDREQPVRIEADSASLDEKRRIATYEGSVVIVQGSLRIAGDLVTMHFEEGWDLESLVAEGQPAHFDQTTDEGSAQKGRAERIEYRVESGEMLFAGSAEIAQGGVSMKADQINYDSVTGSIKGAGKETETEKRRVTITLKGGE